MTDAPIPEWARLSDTSDLISAEPMHQLIEAMLNNLGVRFSVLSDGMVPGSYDFYLHDYQVIFQIDRTHTDRADYYQAAVPNIISVCGDKAINFMAAFLVAKAVKE